MRNIKKDLRMHLIRIQRKNLYYFDENGVFQCITKDEAKKLELKFKNCSYFDGSYTIIELIYYLNLNSCLIYENAILLKKILCMLKEGDTIETLDEYLSTVQLEKRAKAEGLERFITKINNPIFQRDPENKNPKTFDTIVIEANIISDWDEDTIAYIKKNMQEIKHMILEKLKNSSSYKKYGIPVNFLKLTSVKLTSDSALRFVFELKSIDK